MERSHAGNRIREDSLHITNLLLEVAKGEHLWPQVIDCDTHFLEKHWGIKLFVKPLLSINLSDETMDEPEVLTGDAAVLNDYIVDNFDAHLVIYQSSSPYLFGTLRGEGEFGDHETHLGLMVYRPPKEVTDDNIGEMLNSFKYFEPNEDLTEAYKEELRRPRKLLVANIETGGIVFNQLVQLDIGGNSPEAYLFNPIFGQPLMDIASTGDYFVCLARPDRIGKYLEHKDRFDYKDIDELIGR